MPEVDPRRIDRALRLDAGRLLAEALVEDDVDDAAEHKQCRSRDRVAQDGRGARSVRPLLGRRAVRAQSVRYSASAPCRAARAPAAPSACGDRAAAGCGGSFCGGRAAEGSLGCRVTFHSKPSKLPSRTRLDAGFVSGRSPGMTASSTERTAFATADELRATARCHAGAGFETAASDESLPSSAEKTTVVTDVRLIP